MHFCHKRFLHLINWFFSFLIKMVLCKRQRYLQAFSDLYLKSSDAKASKCHLKFSSRMIIFIKPVI